MDTHYDIATITSVASTQDEALARLRESGRPTLVVADRQTAGRGRSSREWIEPDRGMFSSFAFETGWARETRGVIPLCTAVAVRRALAPVEVDLKWPNDLLVGGKKVGGILVESQDDTIVVGCGVNLWWADPPVFAGAVFPEAPPSGAGQTLARAWVDELAGILADGPSLWPHDEYVASCVTVGRRVAWDGGTGVAQTVRADGVLVVDGPDGTAAVLSGDVHLLADG